ncbi:MAG: hypothetical protein SF051_13850 [Elusimicrobiota bacterium]|nr:hypothetical protein [Elusimicrobiota bacterium]
MREALALVLLLSLNACKKAAEETAASTNATIVAGLELLPYVEASGEFSTVGPADWKVKEDSTYGASVLMLGPGTARFPRSVSIGIGGYPNKVDKSADPKWYYDGYSMIESYNTVVPFEKRVIGGVEVDYYEFDRPFRRIHERKVIYTMRESVAIVRVPGGFYRISHHAPVEIYRETYPVFEAVVANFKLGPRRAAKAP